jgi:hypothetical protein
MVDLTRSQVSHELMTHRQSEKKNAYSTSNVLLLLVFQPFYTASFLFKDNDPITFIHKDVSGEISKFQILIQVLWLSWAALSINVLVQLLSSE